MKKLILILCFLLAASPVWGASSCTQTHERYGSLHIVTFSWTTAAGGTFTEWTSMEINGYIDGVETNPDGTAAPTDNYDVVLTNVGGRNICGDTGSGASPNEDGVLANRDTANTEFTRFLDNGNYGGVINQGALTVNINAAGNSKQGKIKIFYYGD